MAGQDGLFPNTFSGVWGTGQSANGVIGTSTLLSGVIGIAGGVGPGVGAGVGTIGTSINSVGVLGSSTNNLGGYFLSTGTIGALGQPTNSAGLFGFSANSIGFQGTSQNNVGVLGYSPGVIGIQALSDTGTALLAVSPVRAAQFNGPVVFNGPTTFNAAVNGAAAPTTATATATSLPHADGSRRQTIGVQAADPLLEDVGEGTLSQGKATVKLDEDFAGLLKGAKYQVFLTPEADSKGLYVTNKSAVSFEVREQQGGTSTLPFSYRILAKLPQQGGKRLERVAPAAGPANGPTNGTRPQDDAAPKPVQPIPVPDVVKEDQKPREGRDGSER